MKRAGVGWLGIATYVVAYDYWACKSGNETLTHAFHRSFITPRSRPFAALGTAIMIKHLLLPKFCPHLDPINRIADRWSVQNMI